MASSRKAVLYGLNGFFLVSLQLQFLWEAVINPQPPLPENSLFLKLIYIVCRYRSADFPFSEKQRGTDLFVFDYNVEIKFVFRIPCGFYRNVFLLEIGTRGMTISGIGNPPLDLSLRRATVASRYPACYYATLIIRKETIAFREIIMRRHKRRLASLLTASSFTELRMATAMVYTAGHSVCRKNKHRRLAGDQPNIIAKTFNVPWINSRGEYSARLTLISMSELLSH